MKRFTKLGSIALGVLLLFLATGTANAQWFGVGWFHDGCRARIEHKQGELFRAERFYGPYSWQANHERYELNRLIDQCNYDRYNGYGSNGFYFNGNFFLGSHHRDREDRWGHRDRDHGRRGHFDRHGDKGRHRR